MGREPETVCATRSLTAPYIGVAFRYNNRARKDNPVNDADRFTLVASDAIGKRLTYKALTGKERETAAF